MDVSGPAALVEALIGAPDQAAETLRSLAPDAEVRPVGEDRVLRGLAEIERYAADPAHEPPTLRGYTLYEMGDNAVVLTQLGVSRGVEGKQYTEVLNVGWLVTVRDDKIVRLCAYPNWAEAKEAAGLTAEREQELMPRTSWRTVLMRIREAAAWPTAVPVAAAD